MKIIIVSNLYPSQNKPFKGTFVQNILEGFKSRGCKVSLISLREPGSGRLSKFLNYLQFTWCVFVSGLKSKEGEVHYVHYTSHSSLGLILASLFKSNKKLVVVSNVHGSDILPGNDSFFSKCKVIISKKILDISTLVVSPSNYFKSVLSDKYGVLDKKVVVSPSGGVDASIFHVLPNIQKEYTFGYVGRLEEDKGVFDLLEAFRLSQRDYPQSKLLIVGSGSCEAQIKGIVDSMTGVTLRQGMSQRQLVEIYNSINYLVFPSKRASESLGLIPIEAMMCGVPVLSSNIGATKDYVTLDMCKLSFEPGNIDELEVILNQANEISEEEYLQLSKLAISVSTNYSSIKVIDDLYHIFEIFFYRSENE
ncbi:glycosyltransferase family 4 protein [Photobacterium leiognathi]|uniref:glycosyltransferase family 4 protein n=1 Tax=Photobacterium leiognathi TaxID=553611 RepID=UPI00020884D8|nr:glycosyltransferase family 4 protein [Photobacterium leiognathi]PSW53765.1 glycosyl hydrolase family 1 [Photobacterium leiognathi subsp. mandapamensis]GAA04678.1 glycosyl transferases group 1 family protein [Photobacterium leiognathi subsp. mandapamensis svers.1.1.]